MRILYPRCCDDACGADARRSKAGCGNVARFDVRTRLSLYGLSRHSSRDSKTCRRERGEAAVTLHGAGAVIGKRLLRKEDARLLTGRGTFVDDVVFPGMLHVAFVRSSVARGRIRSLDV